ERDEALRRGGGRRGALGVLLTHGLAQQEEGHRAHEDGAGRHPLGGTLEEEPLDAVVGEAEGRAGADLRHEVVVVRVEPLRHLERREVPRAAGHREVPGQVEGAVLVEQVGEARRDGAEGDGGVEHLVVEGEVARDGGVVRGEAELDEPGPVEAPLVRGGGLEVVELGVSRPVGLDGALELAARPDARVPEDGRGGQLGCGAVGHRDVLVLGRAGMRGRRRRSTTSSAGRCWLKVKTWRPGAPAATTSSTSRTVAATPTRWRSSSSTATVSCSTSAAGTGTPVSSASRARRRGSVIGMIPATTGRWTAAARASTTRST